MKIIELTAKSVLNGLKMPFSFCFFQPVYKLTSYKNSCWRLTTALRRISMTVTSAAFLRGPLVWRMLCRNFCSQWHHGLCSHTCPTSWPSLCWNTKSTGSNSGVVCCGKALDEIRVNGDSPCASSSSTLRIWNWNKNVSLVIECFRGIETFRKSCIKSTS